MDRRDGRDSVRQWMVGAGQRKTVDGRDGRESDRQWTEGMDGTVTESEQKVEFLTI